MMSSCRSICNFKLAGACWLLILNGWGDEGDVTRSRAANATPVTTARAPARAFERIRMRGRNQRITAA